MNKYTFHPHNRWQQADTDRTSASLIVHSTYPVSPTSTKKLKLDDLLVKKNSKLNQEIPEDHKNIFSHPFPSPKSKNDQVDKKFFYQG